VASELKALGVRLNEDDALEEEEEEEEGTASLKRRLVE